MVKTRSMTRNRNNDVSSRKRRMNTCAGWSDLNHDALYLVMMRLAGVVEFISFSGVCKSWRSLALSNRKRFMGSQPPMRMWCISYDKTCHLQDFRGRKFKTMVPQLVGRECVGLSCGYLILFGKKTRDFWLVNPITRHELHFPGVPFDVEDPFDLENHVRVVLVFSPSLDTWVFFMTSRSAYEIWFSIAGKGGAWNHVRSAFSFIDLLAFKGKIYTLNFRGSLASKYHICEMRLNPVPKLTVIDMHFRKVPHCVFDIISSDENLYLMKMDFISGDTYEFCKLGFDEMICAPCEKAKQEYVLFHGCLKSSAAVKPESWAAPSSRYVRFFDTNYKKRGKDRFCVHKLWYFPHDCLNVDLIDE